VNFEEFRTWLPDNLQIEREIQTLKGRSYFYARYDRQNRLMALRLRTGYQGQLRDDQIQRIFERYKTGSRSERNMTSFYYDPWWRKTPSRILAPTILAIIKAWIEEGR
jgi:hypothetical protein